MDNNRVIDFPDSCRAEIGDDGSYDLCLPSGQHIRGKAANAAAARRAVDGIHTMFILRSWQQGTLTSVPGRGQHFLVPLQELPK
jgi:hypothetical protein